MPRLRVRYERPQLRLWIRWICFAASAACLAAVAFSWVEREHSQAQARVSFEQLIQEHTSPAAVPVHKQAVSRPITEIVQPLAKLEIKRLGISGYVEEGLDTATLARAIGHSPTSARPGSMGNIVLAAHRDTFFSGLRDVKLDDVIDVQSTSGAKYQYKVSQIMIVDPKDNWVLQPVSGQDMLTLVTCYPFHFIGNAPQRLIVQAQPMQSSEEARKTAVRPRA